MPIYSSNTCTNYVTQVRFEDLHFPAAFTSLFLPLTFTFFSPSSVKNIYKHGVFSSTSVVTPNWIPVYLFLLVFQYSFFIMVFFFCLFDYLFFSQLRSSVTQLFFAYAFFCQLITKKCILSRKCLHFLSRGLMLSLNLF